MSVWSVGWPPVRIFLFWGPSMIGGVAAATTAAVTEFGVVGMHPPAPRAPLYAIVKIMFDVKILNRFAKQIPQFQIFFVIFFCVFVFRVGKLPAFHTSLNEFSFKNYFYKRSLKKIVVFLH